MNKTLIATCMILIILLSGCTISEYLKGQVPEDEPYSLLDEKEDNADEDIDALIRELTEEIDETEKDSEVVDDVTDDLEELDETDDSDVMNDIVNELLEEEITDDSFVKLTVKESEKVVLKLNTDDPDEDELSYSFTEPLDANGMWQTNYGDAGNYLITVTVSDGELVTTKKVLLVVDRVNVAPIISDVEANIEIEEGETLRLEPQIKDPNGDAVTVTITEPVGNDGVWKTGYTDRGTYDLTITATDGELETIRNIELIVNKNNQAPEIETIEDITIEEGDTITIDPVVSDPNEDDVTVTISSPVGDDGEWETGFTDNGVYEVSVEASDGDKTTTETFTLTVIDVNKAPEIINIDLE